MLFFCVCVCAFYGCSFFQAFSIKKNCIASHRLVQYVIIGTILTWFSKVSSLNKQNDYLITRVCIFKCVGNVWRLFGANFVFKFSDFKWKMKYWNLCFQYKTIHLILNRGLKRIDANSPYFFFYCWCRWNENRINRNWLRNTEKKRLQQVRKWFDPSIFLSSTNTQMILKRPIFINNNQTATFSVIEKSRIMHGYCLQSYHWTFQRFLFRKTVIYYKLHWKAILLMWFGKRFDEVAKICVAAALFTPGG